MSAIAKAAREGQAQRVFFISEAWFRAYPEVPLMPVSQDPKREENLIVFGQDNQGQSVMAVMPIIRSGQKVLVGATQVIDPANSEEGRLQANILEGFFDQPKERLIF